MVHGGIQAPNVILNGQGSQRDRTICTCIHRLFVALEVARSPDFAQAGESLLNELVLFNDSVVVVNKIVIVAWSINQHGQNRHATCQ
jgi:hypothetical protein